MMRHNNRYCYHCKGKAGDLKLRTELKLPPTIKEIKKKSW